MLTAYQRLYLYVLSARSPHTLSGLPKKLPELKVHFRNASGLLFKRWLLLGQLPKAFTKAVYTHAQVCRYLGLGFTAHKSLRLCVHNPHTSFRAHSIALACL